MCIRDRAPIGAQLLLKTLEGLEQGSIAPQKQNDQESTYASMLDKNLSAVNWNKSSREVHNLIRGLTPWPTAYTCLLYTSFADKVAVAEETVRLRSHFQQLEQMLQSDEAIGRKLDFIVQEMNREVNTIGSKAVDAEIAHMVVDMKAEIEKIREQIQNVE